MTTRPSSSSAAGLSQPVVDPAAGRPAGRRDRAAAAPNAATTRTSRSSSCATSPTTSPTTCSPASRAPALRGVLDAVAGRRRRSSRVTPIFSASYSGLFKSFFDVLDADVAAAASRCCIGATGGTAAALAGPGARAAPAVRLPARAVVAPTAVFAASEDWADGRRAVRWPRGSTAPARELADLVVGGAAGRRDRPVRRLTPFERLLSGDA